MLDLDCGTDLIEILGILINFTLAYGVLEAYIEAYGELFPAVK